MKSQTKTSLSLMLFACLLCYQKGQCQDNLRTIGLGVELSQIELFELFTLNAAPGKNISLTINASDKFRIEPFFGFANSSSKDSDSESKSKSSRLGLGIYGMKRIEKLNYLYGFSIDKINSSTTYTSDFYNEKSVSKGFSWGLEMGAEYMLTDRFSLSAMIGLINLNLSEKVDGDDIDTSGWHSETSIFVKYYF